MVREQKYAGEGRLERASRGSTNPFARDSSYLPGEVEGNLSAKPEPGPLSLRVASSDRPYFM
jgi:hypothetical protein